MRMLRLCLLASVLFAVTGCGFQLQGVTRYPAEFSPLYLDVPEPNSDLAFQLNRVLGASQVTLARDPAEAGATLHIVEENFGRRVKSISAQNRPAEFEVFYEIEYLVSSDGETLVARQPVKRARIFPYSERDILARQQEEELLRDALAREIANVIARRLADLGD
ncbi:LPS assembly lipoprotein LptE [Wenzhouxiangella sp. XN24]|uniref:LPS-assembly lipoprotein LptE n=1 Tax=Wenzhouxiangella sp. XN24 TaxID=2713569 RepID=UPI0013ECD0EB|nr:LPS assembly lipoprotein LptE [Wenzhouxiangella sp. XN24]NGX14753.1 hypothetical protein [Wenzhouxiangella sp. XN24]